MDITDPAIERYAQEHTTRPAPWLDELAERTRASLSSPQMLTGPLAGRVLELLVWTSGARRVLELGTYSGYSALTMAGALPPGGKITTLERDARHAAFAREAIAASPHADRIEVLEGDAYELAASLDGPWDLVFIDADKPRYPDYAELLLPRLAEHGFMVLDNMLRDGEVLDPERGDEGSRAIAALNDRLAGDPSLVTVLLPVRDGMTVVRRA